ncbi:MAG: rhodanese-like domain-containing protein [Phycisphaerae bacterium]
MAISIVTTDTVVSEREAVDVRLIDVRSVNAYNGWPGEGQTRGGHIPGARGLPAMWLNYMDWPDIAAGKGLNPEQRLILYGPPDADALESIGERFLRAGYEDVRLYPDFTSEWCGNHSLPLDCLHRYRQLVSPEWLDALLSTGTAPAYENYRYVLCHGHYRNREDYEQGHIPGAIEIDTNTLESPDTWNRRSPQELHRTLEHAGITHDTTVVLYGRFSYPDYDDPYPGSSAGHLAAIRCGLIMLYAGVRDVRILNGGIQSWLDAGYEITSEETTPRPVDSFGVSIPQRPELLVDTPEAKEILTRPDENLISVRSRREFLGEVSGYHYIKKKGRIPGAVFGNCGSDAYHMENYRNVDHTTREYQEIRQLWAEAGITPDKRNVFYCGTGWRASEAFLNAWLMGWPDIAVYDGGWFEWSNDDSNPCLTGTPVPDQQLSIESGE